MTYSGEVVLLTNREDNIVFTLSAEDTVINDTVKVIASISGMVTRDITEAALRTSIRDMLNRFIDAPWQISNLTRTMHPSGLEALTLNASARVPESENRALDKRRQDASRPDDGLTISKVITDLSFPTSLVEKTERRLRGEIIRKAREECDFLAQALERPLRIKQIAYDYETDSRDGQFSNQFSNQRVSASMASMKTSYGSGFAADASAGGEDVIGNAQKLVMRASITLAAEDRIPG